MMAKVNLSVKQEDPDTPITQPTASSSFPNSDHSCLEADVGSPYSLWDESGPSSVNTVNLQPSRIDLLDPPMPSDQLDPKCLRCDAFAIVRNEYQYSRNSLLYEAMGGSLAATSAKSNAIPAPIHLQSAQSASHRQVRQPVPQDMSQAQGRSPKFPPLSNTDTNTNTNITAFCPGKNLISRFSIDQSCLRVAFAFAFFGIHQAGLRSTMVYNSPACLDPSGP